MITSEHNRFQRVGCVLIPCGEVRRSGIVPMGALPRAGSVVALLVLLVLALLSIGLGPGPALAPGPPVGLAAAAGPGGGPADGLECSWSAALTGAHVDPNIPICRTALGSTPAR